MSIIESIRWQTTRESLPSQSGRILIEVGTGKVESYITEGYFNFKWQYFDPKYPRYEYDSKECSVENKYYYRKEADLFCLGNSDLNYKNELINSWDQDFEAYIIAWTEIPKGLKGLNDYCDMQSKSELKEINDLGA